MVSSVYQGRFSIDPLTFAPLIGHSDVLMGLICTNNDALAEQFNFLQLGECSPSPAYEYLCTYCICRCVYTSK